jgi:hypothetical protein
MGELRPRPPETCIHCSGPTTLALKVDRLGDKPGMQVFQCHDCTKMTWIPQDLKSLGQPQLATSFIASRLCDVAD